MAVDAIRRCYSRRAIFYRGQTIPTRIVWSFVPPGTPCLPVGTCFTPLASYRDWPNVGQPGEQTDSPPDWTDQRDTPPWADGSHYEGTEADHLGLTWASDAVNLGTITDMVGCFYHPTIGVGFDDMVSWQLAGSGAAQLSGHVLTIPVADIFRHVAEAGAAQLAGVVVEFAGARVAEAGAAQLAGVVVEFAGARVAEAGAAQLAGVVLGLLATHVAEAGAGEVGGIVLGLLATHVAEAGAAQLAGVEATADVIQPGEYGFAQLEGVCAMTFGHTISSPAGAAQLAGLVVTAYVSQTAENGAAQLAGSDDSIGFFGDFNYGFAQLA